MIGFIFGFINDVFQVFELMWKLICFSFKLDFYLIELKQVNYSTILFNVQVHLLNFIDQLTLLLFYLPLSSLKQPD